MRRVVVVVAALVIATCNIGCAGGKPQTTRLTAADILIATDVVREKLAASPWLASRNETSPELTLEAQPATNLSNERLSRADRSVVVSRVVTDPGVLELLHSKNVQLVSPQGAANVLARYASVIAHAEPAPPTHALRAEVRTLTRQASESASSAPASLRTDTYSVSYSIVDIRRGQVVWADDFEFKRVARGLTAD